jgi:NADH:ubiquinone oxidoreductase subunit 5 (subunit L)/multisubunit Na+/H+ antiporter MnhA subunit
MEAAHGGGLDEWSSMAIALLASAAGIAVAWARYGRAMRPAEVHGVPAGRPAAGGPIVALVKGKFYVDEAIEAVVLRPYRAICRFAGAFDERVVDALVNATGHAADIASQVARLSQTGYVRNYALVFFLGTVAVLLYVLR